MNPRTSHINPTSESHFEDFQKKLENTLKPGMAVHARKSQLSRDGKEDEGLTATLNHTGNPRPAGAM